MHCEDSEEGLHHLVFSQTIDLLIFHYFADVKVSVIVPVTKDINYLEKLRAIVKKSFPISQGVELVLVEEFDPQGLHKVAEKPEAQLYMAQKCSLSQKFEAGAFHATGDIFYFLMPGYLPPLDFGDRIIRACKYQLELGTFPGKWTKRFLSYFPIGGFEKIFFYTCSIDNLVISRKLFQKSQGLRWDGKDRKLDYLLTNARFPFLSPKFIP